MNKKSSPQSWATNFLLSNGYSIEGTPENVLSTPWSQVMRFPTSKGNIFLKQTPSATFLSSEPNIIRILFEQFHASVPEIIASNDDLHCFMMKDAGQPLRDTLKVKFDPELLCKAIKQFGAILRSTEKHVETFLQLGVPDWRLDKLPSLYDAIIEQTDFLIAEGLTNQELQTLKSLSTQFQENCKLLSEFKIPDTLGYHDFNDKNTLFDPLTQKMTFTDWGECAIIHPFFSLYNCVELSLVHHGVKEGDATYLLLQEACMQNWLSDFSKKDLIEILTVMKKVRPFYGVLACYEFMHCLDLQAYKAYYANRPSQICVYFKQFLRVML